MAHYMSTHAETTHAHPLTLPTPRTISEHCDPSIYYNDLFTNGLRLRGLQGEGRSNATQVYCPEVRRSYFNGNSPINHLDSVSCWRGLDLKQADEIFAWERVFRKALEEQITGEPTS